jgi:SNF2 family DNA or RNA helicase
LYKEDKGGILADDMGNMLVVTILIHQGLGKTIQTIAFICAVLGTGGKEQVSGWSFFTNKGAIKPILIVMPASVMEQWQRELEKVLSCSCID